MLVLVDHIHIYAAGAGIAAKLLPLLNALFYLFAIFATGLLLAQSFLDRNEAGNLLASNKTLKDLSRITIFIWLVIQYGLVTVQIANLFQVSIAAALHPTLTFSFLLHTGIGESELLSFIFASWALIFTSFTKKISGLIFAFVFTLLAAVSPAFQAHASALSNHGLATGAIIFHVLAFVLWIGSLFGLLLLSPNSRKMAISRVSAIAWWSAITVVITGFINAVTRLTTLNSLLTLFSILIYLKILLTLGILVIANKIRSKIKNSNYEAKSKSLRNEMILALLVVVIGGWLDTIAPPDPGKVFEPTQGYLITGINPPPAPNISHLLGSFNFDGLFTGILIFLGLLYYKGWKLLKVRGDKWPRGRTISFIAGWLLALYVVDGGLSIYAHYSFAYHMIAHMLFGMGVPILWSLSAPITLALRTLPRSRDGNEDGPRQVLTGILNSRYTKVITNPVVALGIFDGSLFLLYFTPLFGTLMLSHTGHFLMNLHFLLSGMLFFFIIIGVDPNPHKIPYVARIVLLAAAMSIHSFFSIALLSSSSLMDHGYFTLIGPTWISNYLSDQHSAGAIGWAMSDLPILFALIATFIQWVRDDKKEAERFDRNSARAHAAGESDELDKYNQYLAKLNRQDGK